LFALLSLQTQEGYSGATQYGISRMNGGFASRPGLGVVPPGGPGARWRRDVRLLRQALAKHDQAPRDEWAGYDDRAGLGLVWLEPWDGATSLDRGRLHPLYIEICRRVRLVSEGGRLIAYQTGTKARRIVEAAGGATGDPWTPIATKDNKALTVPARGFHYRLMSDLLVGTEWSLPLLSRALPGEPGPLSLVARALTRGQGKTEGLHERTIPLPAAVVSVIFGGAETKKDAGQLARDRIDAIGELQAALDFAARVLVQGGPQEVSPNATRNAFTGGLRLRLDAYADITFFEDLWAEIEAGSGSEAWQAVRRDWMAQLYRFAHRLLVEAGESLPAPSARRARARVEAEGAFRSGLAKKKQWKDFLPAYWAQRRPPGEGLEPDAREDAA
jgi:CRISPR system Cascade subunit CasA